MHREAVATKPSEMRARIRRGEWAGPTVGCCDGYVQANLVVLPRTLARDFLLFCERNPAPCPLLEATEPGEFEPRDTAPGADLRTDLPRYRVYRNGELDEEVTDLLRLWNRDLVSFLLGCSFTFDDLLARAGIPVRHREDGRNVSMYVTNRPCAPAGRFAGPMVVSMRPIPSQLVARATSITSRMPFAHGAPVHAGDPGAIGISDLSHPDFGDAVTIGSDEIPVFWACGVTPQAVAMASKPDLMITHAPGHMFITDRGLDDESNLLTP
jgi:uncharacterized protein YcsI (UPF0317 family)